MITNQPGIELVGVRLDHPRGVAPLVSDANMRVTGGERVLIVGAAGVGTSRLVAAALGEAPIGAGRIEVLGRDVAKLRRASLRLLRRHVGIVPQDLCLIEDRSAQLNVVLPLEIDGVPRAESTERAASVLAVLGLEAEAGQPVDTLSMAARQRVAVARALVRNPALLIADQPTSAQDAEGAELVCAAIAEAALAGTACLVLGRDPALRAIAERDGWRQLVMAGGALRPLTELVLDGAALDELLVDSVRDGWGVPPASGAAEGQRGASNEPAPLEVSEPVIELPNLLPFPIARPVGAR